MTTKDIKELTRTELVAEITTYDSLIHGENPCYGRRDMIYYSYLLKEADSRGIKISRHLKFVYT